jgi:hypothetical protein
MLACYVLAKTVKGITLNKAQIAIPGYRQNQSVSETLD